MSNNSDQRSIPFAALALGVAGLIPFVALSVASFLYSGLMQSEIVFALVCYGAVILSFLGGVHWGVVLGRTQETLKGVDVGRLIISVIPSLVAWVALLLPEHNAVSLLLAAFVLMLVVDVLAVKKQVFPLWFGSLRWGLTIIVCLSLGAAFVNLR